MPGLRLVASVVIAIGQLQLGGCADAHQRTDMTSDIARDPEQVAAPTAKSAPASTVPTLALDAGSTAVAPAEQPINAQNAQGVMDGSGVFCQMDIPHDDADADSPSCTLDVQLTTNVMSGDYDKTGETQTNTGAIWIEDSAGRYVKTLKLWLITQYPFALRGYVAKRYFCKEMDVIASASLHANVSHRVSWDGRDLHGYVVPDGDYQLQVEIQIDEHHVQPIASFAFTKGRTPWTSKFPPRTPLSELAITYVPNN